VISLFGVDIVSVRTCLFSESRSVWNCRLNLGDNLLPRLNICESPIANKYREGKFKSTLERELKERETGKVEGMVTSSSAA